MTVKLRKFLIRMSKLSICAMIICQSISLALADDATAQRKKLSEIDLNVTLPESTTLKQVVSRIEEEGVFTFVYSKNKIGKTVIKLDRPYGNMMELLNELSVQARVNIRRINETIVLKEIDAEAPVPLVEDRILLKVLVSGTITDENGEALPGATIQEKGTTNGTITDYEGAYSLSVPEDATLIVSFVGYQTQEVQLNGRSVLDLSLEADISALEEVVVVGYGTQKKVNLTGAVESVDTDLIVNRSGTNVSNVLSGQISGLTITQTSGQPGNDTGVLHVRGIGTIRDSDAATGPLIIVDGVQSSLENVAVDDIKSVSVLKDAASAAIYGVRAANGVVLITTKRGDSGKTTFTYNAYGGFQQTTRLPNFLGSAEYATLFNEALRNDGSAEAFSQSDIDNFRNGTDPDNYPNSDWIGELLDERAFQQSHHLQMSGGNEKNKFSLSLNYLDKDGLMPNTGYERLILRSNLDHKVGERLNVGLNLSLTSEETIEPSRGSWAILYYAFREHPTVPIKYSNGNWGSFLNESNSVAMANDGGKGTIKKYTAFTTLFAEYKIADGLSFKATASNTYRNRANDNFITNLSLYNDDVVAKTFRSSVSATRAKGVELDLWAYLNYAKEFGDNHFNIMVGTNKRNQTDDVIGASINDLPVNNSIDQLDAGNVETETNSGNLIEYRLVSLFSRMSYNYREKYLLEANFRYDGTSRFPASNRFAFFPSFSVGWRLSEESFLMDNEVVSNLKIRGSWGKLGNQDIGNYPYQSTYVFGSTYSFGNSIYSGIRESSTLANRNITWEVSEITNVGVDLGLFEDQLSITSEFFVKNTNDILLNLPLPNILGATPPLQNAGVVQNKGVEVALRYRGTRDKLDYFVNGNFTYIKNEILDLKGTDYPGRSVGDPVYNIFGYATDGLFQTQSEIDNGPDYTAVGQPLPGDIRYVDVNGDGIVDSDDRQSLGSFYPKYDFGLSAGLNFSNFDLTMVLQGVAGVKRELRETSVLAFYNGGKVLDIHEDRWTPENPDASYPRLSFNANTRYNSTPNSFFVQDAGFIKCRNIQVGYTIPGSVIPAIEKLRFYISVDNAFTITDFEIFDPEVPNQSGIIYPQVRTFLAGINLKF